MKKNSIMFLVVFCAIHAGAQTSTNVNFNAQNIGTDSSESKYATLYVYRPKNFVGSLISYELHVNDSAVCRIKNNTKYVIHLDKPGEVELWAKTEQRASIKMNVEAGKKYYLKCGVKTGIIEGRPELNLIQPAQGELDFVSVEGRK
jgi:uncharacterized protein DUF2846